LPEERHVEKTCHECKCREHSPQTAMMERMDAWQAARSLISSTKWADDFEVTPQDVMMLADWLLYGPTDD
jgi:hypothetical protein